MVKRGLIHIGAFLVLKKKVRERLQIVSEAIISYFKYYIYEGETENYVKYCFIEGLNSSKNLLVLPREILITSS